MRFKIAIGFIIIGILLFFTGYFNFFNDSVHEIMCQIFGIIIFALGLSYLICERIFETINSLVHGNKIFNICCFIPFLALYVYILINYFINKNEINDFFEKTPIIKDEASLENAFHNSCKTYIIDNLLISGKPITDYNDLFSSELLYLKSSTEEYSSANRKHAQSWHNIYNYSYESDSTLLCDKYKISLNKLYFVSSLPINMNDVFEKYKSKFADNYYYPNKIGDYSNNTRQIFNYIKNNSNISLIADIGNDTIKIAYLCNSKFVTQGNKENLREKYSDDENSTIYIWSIIFIIGSILFFIVHEFN
ncbi:MAG: hypothetical protein MJ211_04010 [Bacteroidales bacterium]|nr:hypothetical protein [Bacteroidales bacterium]